VVNNMEPVDTLQVPVAATAAGRVYVDLNGIGSGSILHADYSLVTSSKPSTRRTVLIYLTGLVRVTRCCPMEPLG